MARDASQPRPDLDGTQDAALVDAPCSGTGVIAEKPDLRYRLTREGLEELASTQKKILDSVSRTVRPGGLLVYATCSVLPRENEQQVREFLASHPEFSVCPMGTLLPEDLRPYEGECGLQILPWRDNMDGFYICRMRRGTRA
jgi:16S rRNA (cytosine967-C5)-methyltransferase